MKLPFSVLVVVHTAEREMLLLQRAARPEFWQSVTGSLDRLDEPPAAAAARELGEETGIDASRGRLRRWNVSYTFEIYQRWRHRFAPGVTHNTEHLYSFELPRRESVTLAPQEHTAFAWLPWREAAQKCFSWSNRDAILMIGAALLAAGCAGAGEARAADAPECAQWLRDLDREVDAAGVRDAQYARVPGFPHLRVDRLHASLRERAAASEAALGAFVERLADLDLESRRIELRNMSALGESARAGLERRLRDCSRALRDADLASPQARAALLAAARVPDSQPTTRPWDEASRAAFRRAPSPANRVRYAPPAALQVPREVVAGLLARAAFNPLGHPLLSEREIDQLAAVYAPTFEVEILGDRDRFGQLRWRRITAGGPPDVDAARPAVYVHAAYTRYREHILLQLVYTIWFAGPLDGMVWRVTLAPDGEPLVYDSIHACGSFHVFYPTPRARLRPPPEGEQAVVVPRNLPRASEGERPLVTLAAGTHYVQAVEFVHGTDSLVRYPLRAYDELRSLPRAGGQRSSIFGPDGLIAGAKRAEPGTLRQWGRQATARGQHFDDADLFERRFEFSL